MVWREKERMWEVPIRGHAVIHSTIVMSKQDKLEIPLEGKTKIERFIASYFLTWIHSIY